jgi:hypothetical protein
MDKGKKTEQKDEETSLNRGYNQAAKIRDLCLADEKEGSGNV